MCAHMIFCAHTYKYIYIGVCDGLASHASSQSHTMTLHSRGGGSLLVAPTDTPHDHRKSSLSFRVQGGGAAVSATDCEGEWRHRRRHRQRSADTEQGREHIEPNWVTAARLVKRVPKVDPDPSFRVPRPRSILYWAKQSHRTPHCLCTCVYVDGPYDWSWHF